MSERESRPGEEVRLPLEQPIALRFKYFDDFIEERSTNLSSGGMFIRTANPHPVSTVFEFELALGAGRPPLTGKAQVAWIRRHSKREDQPVGMGVRFVELEDASRRVIQQMLADHHGVELAPAAASGEQRPSRAAPAPPLAAPRPPRAAAGAPAGPPAAATVPIPVARAAGRSPGRRRRWLWLLLPAALALAVAVAFWPRPAGRQATGAAGVAEAPEPEAAPAEAGAAGLPDQAPAPETDPAEAVDAWARAWSEQRVEDYLAAYSRTFEPPDGLSREEWQLQRRTRLRAPGWIKVQIGFVEVETIGGDRRRVRFVQSYESDSYRDFVLKVLELEREEGAWRIVRESVEALPG